MCALSLPNKPKPTEQFLFPEFGVFRSFLLDGKRRCWDQHRTDEQANYNIADP